jgi:hypothetical protein
MRTMVGAAAAGLIAAADDFQINPPSHSFLNIEGVPPCPV